MLEKHLISKSTYMMGSQCQRRLWLHKNRPDLKEENSASKEKIYEKGTDIGLLAQNLFPGGFDASPEDTFSYSKSVIKTKTWIEEGKTIIYEAAFQYNQVLCALDILVFEDGAWHAYEVKSSTTVKDYHISDAALQWHVITNAGIKLKNIYIIHLNKEYIKNGAIDLSKLFLMTSVKKEVKKIQKEIQKQVPVFKSLLTQKKEPNISIGLHCLEPFICEFSSHCRKNLPQPSIFDISQLSNQKKFDLHKSGITKYEDLPSDFKLSKSQKIQVDSHLDGSLNIEKENILTWLKKLKFPLYFMDFETFMPAVPLYDKTKPFQQIPFQFSVHLLESPDAQIQHFSFLGAPNVDPRPEFLQKLIETLKNKGTVLAYNKTFECSRLSELQIAFPNLKHKIKDVLKRIEDLMTPFQKKWYYDPKMNGSYSIKDVLPSLLPELSYKNMEIGDGGTAMSAFEGLLNEKDVKKVEKIRQSLLKYCEMDTYAMVKILEKLRDFQS